MAENGKPTPSEQIKALYEESESRTAAAFEQLVSRDSFGELLARMTENVVAMTKIGTDVFDLILRNLRLAGRQDVTRLARQLARVEDKLEMVLQEVERLETRSTGGRAQDSRGSSARQRSSRGGASGRAGGSGRTGAGDRASATDRT